MTAARTRSGAQRSAQPSGVPLEAFASPSGVTAWIVEDHSIPLVSVRAAFRGGAAQDQPETIGTGALLAGLFDEGAGALSSREYHERLDELAIQLSFGCGSEEFNVNLRTLTRNLDDAGDLLRLALVEPRFDADAIERVRAEIVAGLKFEATDPDAMANLAFWAKAFPDHPYGRPSRGTIETVARIAREDIVARHKRGFGKDNLLVTMVGDFDRARLGAWLDRVFGDLPAKAKLDPVAPGTMQGLGETDVVTHDVNQSAIRFGRPAVGRKDSDFIPVFVANHIFGGHVMQARLFTEVREKRGLTYGAYASLYTWRKGATLAGSTSTKNERVGETLQVIREQVSDMAENGPTAEELASAKKYLIGSFPLRFDSSMKIAGELMGLRVEELDIDYLGKRNAMIEAVSLSDVRRASQRLFGDGKLLVTVVGTPQGL
jgi:zinc protease